jgi:hypothetical protein
MIDFHPGREQDASPTIRGFKYQIQLTLQRWLDLPTGDTLYLECGEDIDRVLHAPDAAGVQRELEQVKARSRSITLRSPDVLLALANFAAHLVANPGLSLRFRFTTTALPGRERLSPLSKGVRAIQAWYDLQRRAQWTADDDDLLEKLGQLIRSASRPEDCPPNAWLALMDVSTGTAQMPFAEFVVRFEWSYGSDPPEDLDLILRDRLGRLPGDTGPSDPSREQRYNQLVAALLDLLSTAGEKSLTKESLNAALAKSTLTEHDRSRLKLLEERAASHDAVIDSLQLTIQQIEAGPALPILFGTSVSDMRELDLSGALPRPPPLVATLVHRAATVDGLAQSLDCSKWLSLHGDFGTGKSHLSALIAERHGGTVLGVSLKDLTPSTASRGLELLLRNPATKAALQSTAPGVVLLDDLPDVDTQSRMATILSIFAATVIGAGRVIVSTGRRALPPDVAGPFGNALVVQAAPPFSDDDALELFKAHNVPEKLLSREAVLSMNVRCGGHPMVLTALARDLFAHPDNPTQRLVEALTANKFRAQLDLETARAVLNTIEADACRNLLFRLASAGIALDINEIRTVAIVEPSLPEPTVCVARLDGLWLRRTADDRYEVSPLTTPLACEVPEQVNKLLHRQLGSLIFRRHRLLTSEFMRAILSLSIADEYESAAMHLVRGCAMWPRKVGGYSELGVLLFFPPNGAHSLRPSTELPLRGLQAVTAGIEGRDPEPYLARISSTIQNPTQQIAVSAMLTGSLMLACSLSVIPMRVAAVAASLVERFLSFDLPEDIAALRRGKMRDAHLLLSMACVRDWNDLAAFVELLASLTVDRRHEVASLDEVREGMQVVVTRPLFDPTGGVTTGAFDRLREIEERCMSLGLDVFAAYAAAGQLIVVGEYEKDVERMIDLGERARNRFAHDPAARAVVVGMLGQQLYLAKRPADGLSLLAEALADRALLRGLERANRLVDALSAAWESDADPGQFTNQLAELLQKKAFSAPEALCQMHAQVALVRWRQARRTDAFAHLEAAVLSFFELHDRPRTRQLGAGLTHVLNYCASIAESGKPPDHAADGSPYAEGQPRMFSGVNTEMAGMWQARQGPAFLHWALGRLAEALGQLEAASLWTDRAQEAAVESRSASLLMLLAPRTAATAARRGAWADAIEAAITHGRARVFLEDSREKGESVIADSLRFDPLDAPAASDAAERAERYTLWLLSQVLVSELGAWVNGGANHNKEIISLAKTIEEVGSRSLLRVEWEAMARALILAGADEMTVEQHNKAITDATSDSAGTQRLIAHGLLSLRADSRLIQAAVSQIGVMKSLSDRAKPLGIPVTGYAEAVSKFWTEASARAPFQFSSPREISKAIAEAHDFEPLQRVKSILRTISVGLGISLSPDLRTWLSQ